MPKKSKRQSIDEADPLPPRRSERKNKAQPPPYLDEYQLNDTPAIAASTPMPKSAKAAVQFGHSLSGVEMEETRDTFNMVDTSSITTMMQTLVGQMTVMRVDVLDQLKSVQDRIAKIEDDKAMNQSAEKDVLVKEKLLEEPEEFAKPSPKDEVETERVQTCNHTASNFVYGNRHKLQDLPIFSGKAEEWPMFVTSYRETTKEYGYSNLENLTRLQKCLQGNARQLVEALLIHSENVPEVIEELEFRYGRSELLVKAQISKLRKTSPIKEEDLTQLIAFSTQVRNLVAFLRSASADQHLSNPMLLEELVTKLPMSRRMDWAGYLIKIDSPSIADFSIWLRKVANVASMIEFTSYPTTSGQTSSRSSNVKKLTLHTANVIKPESTCRYCAGEHLIATCSKFADMSNEQKWDWVKKESVCFCCLRKGHRVTNCRKQRQCGINNCKLRHHQLLHRNENNNQPNGSPSTSMMSVVKSDGSVFFRIVAVTLFGPRRRLNTFAMLDEGSAITVMEDSLARELELVGKKDEVTMQWLDNSIAVESSTVVNCDIQGIQNGARQLTLRNVRAIHSLNLPCQSMNFDCLVNDYPQLRGVPIRSYFDAKPRLLIGIDNARLGYARAYIDCPPSGPIAVDTELGWIVYGPGQQCTSSGHRSFSGHVKLVRSTHQEELNEKYEKLNRLVHEYYDMDNFGVKKPVEALESNEVKRARKILKETTSLVKGHCETGLLWKTDQIRMPDSYPMAIHRLRNLDKKMKRDPAYASAYESSLKDFVAKGYARKLSPEEASLVSPKTWYLPHFGVQNPSKPAKIRLVFDAAAMVNGTSLNSQLLKGPDLNQPLMSVLSQFRENPIAVCADIQEMFCQVKIVKKDRESQRFLWRQPGRSEVDVFEMESMIFGATCSPAAAQYVKNMNAQRFISQYPEAVDSIIKNHYVDDYVKSFIDENTAIKVSKRVKAIHQAAGFNLRNFSSNSIAVAEEFADENKQISNICIDMNVDTGQTAEKVLGLFWHSEFDEFKFEFMFHKVPKEVLHQVRPPTKREMLSLSMSLFDPFGFLANYHICAKVLLQDTWKDNYEWDQPMPENVSRKWYQWQSQLEKVKLLRIPRCYSEYFSRADDIELHTFVDASEVAYAAVSYWRIITPGGIQIAFVQGKTRVAPRKQLSIPRLELQAGVLGVRLSESILSSHSIKPSKRFFWSDSKTFIFWVKSESRNYKPFVGHRIAEILEYTKEFEWNWIPTDLNVADDATRAKFPVNFEPNSRWMNGPEFLQKNFTEWPQQPDDLQQYEEATELKRTNAVLTIRKTSNEIMPDLERFSKFRKLRRTVAWVLRVCRKPLKVGELSAEEEEFAEKLLCRNVQRQVFRDEYFSLMKGKLITSDSSIYKLSPYMGEDNLIRIEGRIDAALIIPFETRRPIILPKDHRLTRLLILFYHEKMLHQNHETVIAAIRQKYYIPCLRSQLAAARSSCQWCKVKLAKPSQPMMGQLPMERLTAFVRPFTFTGLDYFGPLTVAIGRRREKRWVALFTCLTVRAVHLELATDLSTDACIICIRNFVNLRGVPKRIRSDNGTNFVGIKKELLNVTDFFDVNEIQRQLSGFGIDWVVNSPADPSAGGVWERLVQSVKRCLSSTLRERVPREDTLRSLLLEAANIVNSRPLTHVPVDPNEPDPLTPNHFLLGEMNSTQTPGPVNERLMCLRKQWRIAQQLKNHFYRRWIAEYLPVLTRRCKWFEKVPPLKKDDLVIVCDSDLPRSRWQRGKIVKVFAGKDGQVRSADIQTASGQLRRPAKKLAVLDVGVNQRDSRVGECHQPAELHLE